jgi:hypothetical protein
MAARRRIAESIAARGTPENCGGRDLMARSWTGVVGARGRDALNGRVRTTVSARSSLRIIAPIDAQTLHTTGRGANVERIRTCFAI